MAELPAGFELVTINGTSDRCRTHADHCRSLLDGKCEFVGADFVVISLQDFRGVRCEAPLKMGRRPDQQARVRPLPPSQISLGRIGN